VANRVFRARGRGGKKIDFKQWSFIPGIQLNPSGAATVLMGSLAFSSPATLLRLRGNGSVAMDGETDAEDTQVTFGIGLFSTDAVTLGVTALPDPSSEPEFPWIWYDSHAIMVTNVETGVTTPSDIMGAARFVIDSKAMRKIKPGESLAMLAEVSVAANVDINVGLTRVLLGT